MSETMSKKEALERLEIALGKLGGVANRKDYAVFGGLGKFLEALSMATEALRIQPNYTVEGRKGGVATLKKYGKKMYRKWGKLGGRPKKAEAA